MNAKKFLKTINGTVIGLSLCLVAGFTIADEQNNGSVKAKVERVADKTAAAVNKGAVKTKHGLTVASQHTKKALVTAADKTHSALQKAGDKIEAVVEGE